tara:strand:+ start:501 stop:2357 length:1857 start_codon:yes stop_codon:yes gene_type:complete
MCGFFLSLHQENEKLFKKNANFLKLGHRGPDEYKFFYFNKKFYFEDKKPETLKHNFFGFFNRLSIRGLKSNKQSQPIKINDHIILIYNGEIYNCDYLKKKFSLNSDAKEDSALLSEGIKKFGIYFVEYLDGMFSLCLIDLKLNKISFCRDKFGIKPLFYYYDKDNLILASEIKIIVDYLGKNQIEFEEEYFKQILKNKTSCTSELTPFKKIYRSETGRIIEANIKELNLKKMRQISTQKNYTDPDFNNENLKLFLDKDFIRYQISDRQTGLLLSSGVDSNFLALNFCKNDEKFTYGFIEDEKLNEIKYLNNLRHKKLNYFKVTSNEIQSFFIRFCNLSYEIEDNFGSGIQFGLYEFIAKKNVNIKVMFSGQGSDEMSLGYDAFLFKYLEDLIDSQDYLRIYKIRKILKSDLYKKKINDLIEKKVIKNFKLKSILGFLKRINYKKLIKEFLKRKTIKNFPKLHEFFLYRINERLKTLLRWEDLSSMHFSIETRLPYLSLNYYNLINSLNIEKFFTNKGNKSFLRNILINNNYDYWKDHFYNRKKFGYSFDRSNLIKKFNKNHVNILQSNLLNIHVSDEFDISLKNFFVLFRNNNNLVKIKKIVENFYHSKSDKSHYYKI